MRRYDEPVSVRERAPAGSGGDSIPEAFVWRGRLYLVRTVVAHWRQRSAWWRTVFEPDSAREAALFDPVVLEEEVWRVEAAPGRTFQQGIYDLAHGSRWRLLRVTD